MSIKRALAAAQRTKQYQSLIDAGLKMISTDRQLENGTLSFTGKIKVGRKVIRPTYKITAAGAVISNEFVARRVDGEPSKIYKNGLKAVSEILEKRMAA